MVTDEGSGQAQGEEVGVLGGGNDKAEERRAEQEIMILTAPGTKRAESNKTNGEPQSVVAGSHSWWRISYTIPASEVPGLGRPAGPVLVQVCLSAPCVSSHDKKNIAL